MASGMLESTLRSIRVHLLGLAPESLVIVTGKKITVSKHPNVLYLTPHQVERELKRLPDDVAMVLSTYHRSHEVGIKLQLLAAEQHREVPQYILTPGILKKVLRLILEHIGTLSGPKLPIPSAPDKPQRARLPVIQKIGLGGGTELFQNVFSPESVWGQPEYALLVQWKKVLREHRKGMSGRDARTVVRMCMNRAAKLKPPPVSTGRRRDRGGCLPKKRRSRPPTHW